MLTQLLVMLFGADCLLTKNLVKAFNQELQEVYYKQLNYLNLSQKDGLWSLILELATSSEKLIKINEKLKNRLLMPLFNSEHYTKNLEKGFEIAYKKYINQTKPETIDIINNL